ncbi:3-hexulose-6-phosphate synthase [Alkalihalophilus marmarensis]|uniref:3-hexulose-6-phosphate synthase n=1 Tax=Alkalihalophilus marmarensis TaxID=521377 RepID=UPI002E1BD467|nr:3-hexulose-6-phosphate synthase [Alkalihalophilus marmarensis]MED1601688.1 orotidine 5'-phosphate decarboxylase [Alkalihalophilus marmarensis]
MKLQLALDRLTKKECSDILKETQSAIDLIEVGTGVIKEYGTSIIKKIKQSYPEHIIVADMKTCDAGKAEAVQAFEAGADITTVMAFAHDATIRDMVEVAKSYQKRVMVDLLGIDSKERIHELKELGVDLVSLHIGKDMQGDGKAATAELFSLLEEVGAEMEVSVAGGINEESLPQFLQHSPDILIVGSAITKADDKASVAQKMKEMIST